jgi:hypothetical protein
MSPLASPQERRTDASARPRRSEVGYHDLLRDLESPGCPVCRGTGRAAWRYVSAVLWEFVNDGGAASVFGPPMGSAANTPS